MIEQQDRQTIEEEKDNSSGGLIQRFLNWSNISAGIDDIESQQDNLTRIKAAEKWINMPYKDKMEMSYEKGGKYGGNLKEEEVQDANSLRWFIYNLDGNDSKSVKILQKKLNNHFKESGFDDLPEIPTDGEFGQRSINRMNRFIDHYDTVYSRTQDTQEALRAVRELLYHRENEFTIDKDTLNLKEQMQGFNANEETSNIMKDLEMIPK
jgi:hypothetical protein|tara:strand:+ start:186 stop:812 length:627 start_codon:yes stop_codon:yes gene_type:complete